MEMAMAYATLASGGQRLCETVPFNASNTAFPIVIDRVTDASGKVVDQKRNHPHTGARCGGDFTRYLVLGGRDHRWYGHRGGYRASGGRKDRNHLQLSRRVVRRLHAGRIVTAVWVGYPNEQKSHDRRPRHQGHRRLFPGEIWAAFMKQAVKDIPASQFAQPAADQWVSVEVCSESHQTSHGILPHQGEDALPGRSRAHAALPDP